MKPCSWRTKEGKVYKLGNKDLQKTGLPEDVFKAIKKTGRIEELNKPKVIKEKDNGNKTKA